MLTREQLQRAARQSGFPIDSLEKVWMAAPADTVRKRYVARTGARASLLDRFVLPGHHRAVEQAVNDALGNIPDHEAALHTGPPFNDGRA